jgi:hypothetical protein
MQSGKYRIIVSEVKDNTIGEVKIIQPRKYWIIQSRKYRVISQGSTE